MLLEDGYGKTIYLSLEEFLSLTDEEWKNLISMNDGDFISDPFSKKVSYSKNNTKVNNKTNDKIIKDILKEIEEDFDEDFDN
jgi:hypothetical protein